VSGEGSFFIQVNGNTVSLKFSIYQSTRDEALLGSFKEYLNCGSVFSNTSKASFVVTKFSDVYEVIIPLFKKYPILGVKALDFADFCEAAEIVKTKEHLTLEGFTKILEIKARMNRSRTSFSGKEELLPPLLSSCFTPIT
jgi:hypothetical protein